MRVYGCEGVWVFLREINCVLIKKERDKMRAGEGEFFSHNNRMCAYEIERGNDKEKERAILYS